MKTVLFVPGFQEDLSSRDYAKTLSIIEKSGYNVRFVPIEWQRTTIEDWVAQLDQVYAHYSTDDVVLAGFSFGAMTAFVSASERPSSQLWLFSPSPYFNEDLASPGFKKAWLKIIGTNRERTFKKIRFTDLVNNTPSKILFFYGSNELKSWPNMTYRQKLVDSHSHTSTVIVPNGEHDVSSDTYVKSIADAI